MIEVTQDLQFGKPGGHAFITRNEPIFKGVCDEYGRDFKTCALKVFYGNPLQEGETLDDALWGDNHDPKDTNQVRKNTKLMDGTRIQNILWWHKKSPRVYAVFEGSWQGKRVAVQLIELLEGEISKNTQSEVNALHSEIEKIGKEYKFSAIKNIMSPSDVIDGKTFDVQQYALDPTHEDKIREIYAESGRYGKVYYQDVPELGLSGGPRKSVDRIKYLGLDQIDFKGKIVWDVGCAGGFFARYAYDQGAKRVIGFDEERPIFAAFMLANYLKKFNIDYEVLDLRKGISDSFDKPDIVFYLSMNFHIATPQRIFEADTLIFEDNGKESRTWDTPSDEFVKQYKDCKFFGRAIDHGNKAIYHLTR